MFSSHRARSGIIVLPCGAGKTLVGIVAANTIKRSCLVLCNSSVSVEQWYNQFLMWTDIPQERITKFTATSKEMPHREACVLVATYNMLTHAGPRAEDTKRVLENIETREWGLLLMDEVSRPPTAPRPLSPPLRLHLFRRRLQHLLFLLLLLLLNQTLLAHDTHHAHHDHAGKT